MRTLFGSLALLCYRHALRPSGGEQRLHTSCLRPRRRYSRFKRMHSVVAPADRLFVFETRRPLTDGGSERNLEVMLNWAPPTQQPHAAEQGKPRGTVSFVRTEYESWADFSQRLATKLAALATGRAGKRRRRDEQPAVAKPPSVSVGLTSSGGAAVPPATDLATALRDPGAVLRIDEARLRLVLNAPRVRKIEIAVELMEAFPVMPSYDLELSGDTGTGSDAAACSIHWFVEDCGGGGPSDPRPFAVVQRKAQTDSDPAAAATCPFTAAGWTHVHTGETFVPDAGCVGKRVMVVADCGSEAPASVYVTAARVAAEPRAEWLWTSRQVDCAQRLTGDKLRIMSYNVLADLYLNLKHEQSDLFFPYCDKEYQKPSYRYPLLLRELPGYNADIMCLQEVDYRFYLRFLQYYLPAHGYQAVMHLKGMQVNEGCVIAFKADRFRLVEGRSKLLKDVLLESPSCAELRRVCAQTEHTSTLMLSRPAVVQVEVLESLSANARGGRSLLVVATTHLHFQPAHAHVKLMQTALCLKHVEAVVRECRRNLTDADTVAAVLAGDFNWTPGTGCYDLCSKGVLRAADCDEWQSSDTGGHFDGCDLDTTLKLTTGGDEPDFTNYTKRDDGIGFAGCLDYIWLDRDRFRVLRRLRPPPLELVTAHTALPSPIAPSDHLALVTDVQLL